MKLLLITLVALVGLVAARKSYDGYKIYSFSTTDERNLEWVKSLEKNHHYDFLSPVNKIGKPVKVMAAAAGQKTLELFFNLNKISFELVNSNVESSIREERAILDAKRASKAGAARISFDQYYRHAEMNEYIADLEKSYPNLATVVNIGQSYEKREMNVIEIAQGGKISGEKPVIFVDAGIHAREWIAPSVALYIINQLVEEGSSLTDEVDWVVLPSVNPDGYEFTWDEDRMWRKTLSKGSFCDGCDPNRNFGYHWMEAGADQNECSDIYAGKSEFSEVESQNVRDYLATLTNVKSYITLHSCGEYLLYPWGYGPIMCDNADEHDTVGNLIRTAIKNVAGTDYYVGNSAIALYPAAGASDDWAKSTGVDIVFTQELPCGTSYGGFGMDPEDIQGVVEETWEGFKALHKYIVENYSKH